jgi:hypothetical protein
MTSKSKRVLKVAALAASLFLLTSCISLTGNLSINQAGLVDGKITYSIDKQVASLAGITSLSQLNSQVSGSSDAQGLDASCKEFKTKEESTAYVFECLFDNSTLKNGDVQVVVENEKIVFTYRSNIKESVEEAQESDSSTWELGKTEIRIKFPGPIENIQENKTGLVKKISNSEAVISGSGSEEFDIKIVSSCISKCGKALSEMAAEFKEAPSNFGGMIKENMRFSKRNSPYTVKKTIQVPKGKMIYVEPGVTFRSQFSPTRKWDESSTFFVQGDIYFAGTKSAPINLLGAPNIHIRTTFAEKGSAITAYHLNVLGGGTFTSNAGEEGYSTLRIFDSVFKDLRDSWAIWYPAGSNEISRNQFINTGILDIGFGSDEGQNSFVVKHNVFYGNAKKIFNNPTCWVRSWAAYNQKLLVEENDFSNSKSTALCIAPGNSGAIDGRNNYWGTTSERQIKRKVIDGEDNLKYKSVIDVSNPLSERPQVIKDLRKFKIN